MPPCCRDAALCHSVTHCVVLKALDLVALMVLLFGASPFLVSVLPPVLKVGELERS